MLLIFAAAITVTIAPVNQQDEASSSTRATASRSTSNAGMVIARGPTLTGETKTVCRRERPQDSNIPQRVCRVVPANSSQRHHAADEHVREMQRLPFNSERGAAARAPGGRSVF